MLVERCADGGWEVFGSVADSTGSVFASPPGPDSVEHALDYAVDWACLRGVGRIYVASD